MTIAYRPLTEADGDDLFTMSVIADTHDQYPWVLERAEIDEWFTLINPATDSLGAFIPDPGGDLVGWVRLFHMPSETKEERCYIIGTVHPDHRRRGIGSALMSWAIPRATEMLAESGRDLPRFIRTDRYEWVESAGHLFTSFDMAPVRYNDELRRPLEPVLPITDPDGVKIIAWPHDRSDEIRHAKNSAFADHWGSTPTSPALWDLMVDGHGSRRDLSFVAVDPSTDQIVAHCLNYYYPENNTATGRRDGWIGNLGTIAEYRGRGIATALIAHSIQAFVEAGFTHAMLDVDSASETGANRLYEGLGFERVSRAVTHQLEIQPTPGAVTDD